MVDPGQPQRERSAAPGAFTSPQSHRLAVIVSFAAGTVTISIYLDNIQMVLSTQSWIFDATTFYPALFTRVTDVGEVISVTSWRVFP